MASIKVAVSLPELLFEQLERVAEQIHAPRSRVVAAALEDYLGRREVDYLRERINAAYTGGLDADERATLDAYRRVRRGTAVPGEW